MPTAWLLMIAILVGPFTIADRAAGGAAGEDVAGVQLFTAPDENSPALDRVAQEEVVAVIAQSLGPGGTEWYLVKTKTGPVGWIKAGQTNATKTYSRSFKSLSSEPSASLTPGPSARVSPGGVVAVPLDTRGSLAVVAVTFNGRLTASLAVDTGATKTMISRRIADQLALNSSGSGLVSGIGGTVAASFTKVESIRVGAAEVANLTVVVHDFSRSPAFEGLLGLDFLTNFNVALDTKKRLLILSPR